MKRKKLLIILLTVLVFLSSAVLGITSVYRIDEVVVEAQTISATAEEEAAALQTRLLAAYKKRFTPSAKADQAYAVVEDFPYFRITAVEKSYPNRLIVRVQEDDEVYAVAQTDEEGATGQYYILNREGTVLAIRENYYNRADGAQNVLLMGLNATGAKGETLTGDEGLSYLFPVCARLDEQLQGIRRNIVSVEKIQLGSLDTARLKITTYEGVKIYVNLPHQNTDEKATAAMDAYFALQDAQRTRGAIIVTEVEGVVKAQYWEKDVFDTAA